MKKVCVTQNALKLDFSNKNKNIIKITQNCCNYGWKSNMILKVFWMILK